MPSPWPTSHITISHPFGGQPQRPHGCATTATRSRQTVRVAAGLVNSRGITTTTPAQSSVSTASASGPTAQPRLAPAKPAPCRATVTIHHAGTPASRPTS